MPTAFGIEVDLDAALVAGVGLVPNWYPAGIAGTLLVLDGADEDPNPLALAAPRFAEAKLKFGVLAAPDLLVSDAMAVSLAVLGVDFSPAAVDAIASTEAVSLGGKGYVAVGPCPASVSADGSPRLLNRFQLGMPLLHPDESRIAETHPTTRKRWLVTNFFCIPAAFNHRELIPWIFSYFGRASATK